MQAGLWEGFRIFADVTRYVLAFLFSCSAAVALAQEATDTCRFLTYNTLKFDNSGSDREVHFRTILTSVHPDILVTQELMDTGGAARFRDSVVLTVDTNYAMASFIDGYDSDNGLFYRKDKYHFISLAIIPTELRNIARFQMQHIASGVEFYVYSVHLKASSGGENAAQRKREVDSLRKNTLTLAEDALYLVCGDFNMYGDYEEGYAALLEDTQPGFFIDVLQDSLTSTWNNASNARFHTQSTRLDAFGGGSTGGLDDRFDMILCSPQLLDTLNMFLVPPSMKPVGNDGEHYNMAINDPVNTAVSEALADALYFASDHIPLFAEFVFRFTETPVDTTQDSTLLAVAADNLPELQLYPNPVDTWLAYTCTSPVMHYAIVTLDGRMVCAGGPLSSSSGSIAGLGDLPSGNYVLRIQIDKGYMQRTFYKK